MVCLLFKVIHAKYGATSTATLETSSCTTSGPGTRAEDPAVPLEEVLEVKIIVFVYLNHTLLLLNIITCYSTFYIQIPMEITTTCTDVSAKPKDAWTQTLPYKCLNCTKLSVKLESVQNKLVYYKSQLQHGKI